MKKYFILLNVFVMVVFGLTGSAQATLWDRGGGLIYDDFLKITWLQDANYVDTTGYDTVLYANTGGSWGNGALFWDDAMTWADNLVYYDPIRDSYLDDWRLPTALNQDGTGPCSGYDCTGSELGYMFYINLGNTPNGTVSSSAATGDGGTVNFDNLMHLDYWTNTEHADLTGALSNAWYFDIDTGLQLAEAKIAHNNIAWAVRDGDVAAPVPEPATMLLLGIGLAGLAGGAARRKWKKKEVDKG